MENYNENINDIPTIEVDRATQFTLLEMGKWTKFIAIVGFVFIGIMVLLGSFFAMMVRNMPGAEHNPIAMMGGVGMTIYFIFIAGISFYPLYALLKYATNMKAAVRTGSKELFTNAIVYLKNAFKYYGIMMIIILCIYGAFFVGVMLVRIIAR